MAIKKSLSVSTFAISQREVCYKCVHKSANIFYDSRYLHTSFRVQSIEWSKLKSVSELKCGPAHNFMSCLIDFGIFVVAVTGRKTANICGNFYVHAVFFCSCIKYNSDKNSDEKTSAYCPDDGNGKSIFVFSCFIFTLDPTQTNHRVCFYFCFDFYNAHKRNRKRDFWFTMCDDIIVVVVVAYRSPVRHICNNIRIGYTR